MIFILDSVCNSKGLGNILSIIRDALDIIQIIGPILAIVGISICLFKMMTNPDEKKYAKSLKNSIISLLLLFLVPMIVNATMNLLSDDLEIVACWNSAVRTGTSSTYIPTTSKKPTNILPTTDDYELGDKTETPDTNTANVENLLKAAKKVTEYIRMNKFTYGDAPINPAIDDSAKITSCDRCVAWFLYKIGYTDQPSFHGLVLYDPEGKRTLSTYLVNKGFQKISDRNQLQAGDIIFVNPDSRGIPLHTYLLGNKISDGIWERYDCGSNSRLASVQPTHEAIGNFMYAYRMPS